METRTKNLPEQYRPLSAWAYFGYSVLYALPVIGWIFAAIFALNDNNINRRNFSRSFFIILLITIILLLISYATGITFGFLEMLSGKTLV